jgi:hypothetical protein
MKFLYKLLNLFNEKELAVAANCVGGPPPGEI